jgi:hypothetical protein
MPLPPLTEDGELPPGVYAASLLEALDQFSGGSAQRAAVALRLNRIYQVAQATGHVARFVVFGSFVTNKLEPQDVDVFLVMAETFDASRLTDDARLLFDHGAAHAHFGASVFWVRQLATWPSEQAAVEFLASEA